MSRTETKSPAMMLEDLKNRLKKTDPEAVAMVQNLYEETYTDGYTEGAMSIKERLLDDDVENEKEYWGV